MPQRQRILITDGSKYFDNSIWQLLIPEPEFQIIGQASSTKEAINIANTATPDIILVDLSHSTRRGLQTIEALHSVQPNTPIIAFQPISSHEYTQAALNAGAAACLTKSEMADALLQTLQDLTPTRAPAPLY